MTKTDIIQLIQDRASGGSLTNDNLLKYNDVTIAALMNLTLTELAQSGSNIFSNSAYGIEYSALTAVSYIDLSPIPLGGAMGVKYVVDDCGNQYYGRQSIDQNVFLGNIKPLARAEFYVNGARLTFSQAPQGTSYTVYMTPDFVQMDDDTEFSCPNIDQIVGMVIAKIKQTDAPNENVNNTKPDNG